MRRPSQTTSALQNDLKHLSTALERAQKNTDKARSKTDRVKVVRYLSELVLIYTKEVTSKAQRIATKGLASSDVEDE